MYWGLLDQLVLEEPVTSGSMERNVAACVSVTSRIQTAVIRVLESVTVALVTAGSRAANHVRRQITETDAKKNATASMALFVIT